MQALPKIIPNTLKGSQNNPLKYLIHTLKGFFADPWEIHTPPKGSIKTFHPSLFDFPPFVSYCMSAKDSLQASSIILQYI
jgi:hypothetical protein